MASRRLQNILAVLFLMLAAGLVYFWHESNVRPAVQGISSDNAGLTIDFFDVGQGDAALIRTVKEQDILVDGGPDNTVLEKLGRYLPLGDNDLELVILTHPHADHLTGLIAVLQRYRVEKIIMTGVSHTTTDYQTFLSLIKEKNIPVEVADSVKTIAVDASTTLELLWPREDITGQHFSNLNDSSIAFRLDYSSSTALFMGDLEQEEQLASSSRQLIKADLLKVGHHGSTNANSQEFLALVHPAWAVISVGANNSYGLPSYRTIYELDRLGARVLRTDQEKDLIFFSDGSKFYPVR